MAKVSPHVLYPARFGLHIAVHLLSRYAHLTTTFVTVEQLRWARIGAGAGSDADAGGGGIKSEGHKHAFWRDGTEKRFVEVELARKSDGYGAVARVAGGLRDLLGALLSRFFSRPPLFHLWTFSGSMDFMKRKHTRTPIHRSLIVPFRSAKVDGIRVRELRAGRVYDTGRGGRPDLQHIRGSEVYVRGGGREATSSWCPRGPGSERFQFWGGNLQQERNRGDSPVGRYRSRGSGAEDHLGRFCA